MQRLRQRADWAGLERISGQALSSLQSQLGPDAPDAATALSWLSYAVQEQGRYSEAERLIVRALAIDEKSFGRDSGQTAGILHSLGEILRAEGRYEEAEPILRRTLQIAEQALGPDRPEIALSLASLAALLELQGRYAEAESLYQRALSIDRKALGPAHPETATLINDLALLLRREGHFREAEALFRDALAIDQKALGPQHPGTAADASNLGNLLHAEGRYAEAEPLLRQALESDQKLLGLDNPRTAADLNNLGSLLQAQGRYRDAEPMIRQALAIAEQAFGPDHPSTADAHQNLALNDEGLGQFGDAIAHYRRACAVRSSRSRARDQSGDSAQSALARANSCWTRFSLALWNWSAQGGGDAASDQPEALKQEAFTASQRALQSAAANAMARSAALTAAKIASVGPQAQAYEAALLERDDLDRQFATAASSTGPYGIEKRQRLAAAHDEIVSRIDRLAADLKLKAPLYWDYRSPEPLNLAALQAKTGADAALLHDDEALILLLVAPGKDNGLVFAVSKERVGWAQLGFSGDEIKARVIKLRTEIDPGGYGVRGIAVVQGSAATADSSPPGAFDRQAAYQLHQALLADPSIQAVINAKSVLLFITSGALTSLPPGLLVTAPPMGGAARDADRSALRATAWLLRSKAVALLPSVWSLRTLRQIRPAHRISTPDPLLAFADPNFSRPAAAPKTRVASAPARGFSTYFRDGIPLAEELDNVPLLPGTRIEGEALERALHGRPGSLLTGRDASKSELMARNADGRLAQVRVIEFATHGLVAGDASDLAEPALVLAAGATPADELLLASEASTLKLNADWVLLSACNTASPDAPEAQGLSGLSRAFFYAGARSLLVSHWRVRDDVAPTLIPAMLLAERNNPGLSPAEALRQASLAILDNRSLDAADPAAWAPFTLIGEAGR